jgi:tetratricopeptide (TPR) repeat protein
MRFYFFCFFLPVGLLLGAVDAPAQLLTDSVSRQRVLLTLDKIYNAEFAEAEALARPLRTRYPQHPVNPLLQAFQLYWQYLPIQENNAAAQRYVTALNQCIALAEKMPRQDAEATFFLLAAHSYLAMLESDRGELTKAVGEARRTYGYMKRGFQLTDQNPEFFFSTGLYNYYRVQYPDDHALVRPLLVFFQDGDKARGLQQLEQAYRRGTFTRTEAGYYLVYVLIKHEANPLRALTFSAPLHRRYPRNPVYLMRHAEALTLAGRYADAEPLVERLTALPGRVYPVAGTLLSGMLAEKAHQNDRIATSRYQQVLKMPLDKRFTQEYHALAHAGLARLADRAGDRAEARRRYQQALKLAEYKSTIREAKAYLK